MLQSLKELNDQLVSIKAELADKVHTENVKCFRNIQDLFKVMGDKVDTVSELEKQVGTTKTFAVISTVLAYYQYIWLCCIALYILGFFWFDFIINIIVIGWCSSRLGSCTIF